MKLKKKTKLKKKQKKMLRRILIAAALLTVATMYPYLKHRIPEIREENAISGTDAQHASVGRARGDKTRGGR